MKPEDLARQNIDRLLEQAGWQVCNLNDANIYGAVGVAIREFPLNAGHGFADYLLYVNGNACGVIEAKKEGVTLKGVEVQSERYAQGLPAALPAWSRPLPFFLSPPGWRPNSPTGWPRTRVRVGCLRFSGPRCWPSGCTRQLLYAQPDCSGHSAHS